MRNELLVSTSSLCLNVLQNKYQRTSPHEDGIPEDAEEGDAKCGEERLTGDYFYQSPGISGDGQPSAGVSAPTRPSPRVVDSPMVASPELDLPGPCGSTTEYAHHRHRRGS